MNHRAKSLLKNISFSMVSSIISMVISAVVVLIVPKQMTTVGYGYYQLYILYTGYAGFFQFGLIDGIYIRYGGAYYDKLDKKSMYSQFCVLWIMQLFLFAGICILSLSFTSEERLFVLILSGVEMILANTRGMLTYVMQATNRIKEGAISNTIGRITFFLVVLIVCVSKNVDFRFVILADILGRCVALVYSSVKCREIVFRNYKDFKFDLAETRENIIIGFSLMLSSIASLLIMGIVRMAMENKWGIETFAKVSLTVSVSNLMVQFINAASLVFFPVLRRIKEDLIVGIYKSTKSVFMPLLYCSMILYYPISKVLIAWLPQYETGLQYMALLFPICIFEGRMSLLNYTYLKTVSDIKTIFKANSSAVGVSLFCTIISVYVLGSIPLAMFSLLFAVGFRCYFTDYIVSKQVDFPFIHDIICEIVLMASFILSAWFIKSFVCTVIYLVALCIYLFVNKGTILQGINELKKMLGNKT